LVDPEAVRRRLGELDRRVSALRRIHGAGREDFLADSDLQAQAERHLHIALQSVIDIALHIVAEELPDVPESYRDAFPPLARAGVIDADLADRLGTAAGLRNILVHAYLDVDHVRVWEQLEALDDLERFAVAIDAYLVGTG
jgi:uncharacterized protein YutE (UPF0331/DUF86 family)